MSVAVNSPVDECYPVPAIFKWNKKHAQVKAEWYKNGKIFAELTIMTTAHLLLGMVLESVIDSQQEAFVLDNVRRVLLDPTNVIKVVHVWGIDGEVVWANRIAVTCRNWLVFEASTSVLWLICSLLIRQLVVSL